MALNLLRDCKDIKGEEEKKEGCVKHRERSSEVQEPAAETGTDVQAL